MNNRSLINTTPSALNKVASRLLIGRAALPSSAEEGSFALLLTAADNKDFRGEAHSRWRGVGTKRFNDLALHFNELLGREQLQFRAQLVRHFGTQLPEIL